MRMLVLAAMTALTLGSLSSVALAEDPQKLFDQLYGDEAKKIAKTPDTRDDAAFAAKLLKDAKDLKDDPALAAFLLEKASAFGAKNATGYATAIEALDLLQERLPKKNPEWQDKLLKVAQLYFRSAKGTEKIAAGETLAKQFIAAGDRAFEAGQYPEAAKVYLQARQVASSVRSSQADDAADKLKTTNDRIEVEKKIASLQAKLKGKPDDTATAKSIVLLYVQELDNPAEAGKYIETTGDDRLKKLVPLAAKPVSDSDEATCMELAEWYKGLAISAAPSSKRIVYGRAKAYYQQFLVLHTKEDAEALKAKKEIEDISTELVKVRAYSRPHKWILARVKPQSATVGSGHFLVNEVEGGEPVPVVPGKRIENYFRAHAPSSILFGLSPTQMGRRFYATGYMRNITLAGNRGNGVKFIVKIDGKKVYESKLVDNSNPTVNINVQIPPNAKTLNLVVDDLGNNHGDWAYWLDPAID